MYDENLLHMHPTLEIIAQELTLSGIPSRWIPGRNQRRFRSAMIYHGGSLREDVLYILKPQDAEGFPTHRFCVVCSLALTGDAGHIHCPGQAPESILNLLTELFYRCRSMEEDMDALVYRAASLEALCTLGYDFLENPVCIHDDWFILTAMSQPFPTFISADQIASSNRLFVPRQIVDDFHLDEEYAQTHTHRAAQFWNNLPNQTACLYVNLWDGDIYQGRLLVMRENRDFRAMDYLIAECITQRASQLLRRQIGPTAPYRSMDAVVSELLDGKMPNSEDELYLMHMLGWSKTDKLTCIRIRNQQPASDPVTEHVLHSDLFHAFPGSYILFQENQQCIITNISKTPATLSEIRHTLSPLCRDYCLYAGISSPAYGIHALSIAYQQAEIALKQAFRLRDEHWIIAFSDCALDYILNSVQTSFPSVHLAAPELLLLLDQDAQSGTQYFETLKTFLLLERDIPRTSEALIIHRTTLLYRLKKIRSITGLNLDDPKQRLYLLLSLQILERNPR